MVQVKYLKSRVRYFGEFIEFFKKWKLSISLKIFPYQKKITILFRL